MHRSLQFLLTGLFISQPLAATAEDSLFRVTNVIDAATIELENGTVVRYIGLFVRDPGDPSPLVSIHDKEAAEINRLLVEGRVIRLEFDVEQVDGEGHTLAYVYLGDLMLNEFLIAAGLANVSTTPPNVKYAERLKKAAERARTLRMGMWRWTPPSGPSTMIQERPESQPPPSSTTPIEKDADPTVVYVTKNGAKYHRKDCPSIKNSKMRIRTTLPRAKEKFQACSICRPPE